MARYAQDIKGQTFGKLKALRPSGRTDSGARLWLFRCECRKEVERRPSALKLSVDRGHNPRCGSCGEPGSSGDYKKLREGFTPEQRRRYEQVLSGRKGAVIEAEAVEVVVRNQDLPRRVWR